MRRDEHRVKDLAFDLYVNGVSSRDTQKILAKYFAKDLSHATIVSLSSKLEEARNAWEKRKISGNYKVIYADAIRIPLLRDDSYTREAIIVLMGVRSDNKREILHYEVNPTESSVHYKDILKDLKRRGLENVDLVVADGLEGLPDAVHDVFSKTHFQLCTTHKKRNVLNRVRVKDKKRVAADLHYVFDLFEKDDDIREGNKRLDEFIARWKPIYPKIDGHFNKYRQYLFNYTRFGTQVRRLLYTTNSMESINSVLRKGFRNKLSFKNENGLMNYTFAILMDLQERKLMKYAVDQFNYFNQKTQST
jgi:transposase-like protein